MHHQCSGFYGDKPSETSDNDMAVHECYGQSPRNVILHVIQGHWLDRTLSRRPGAFRAMPMRRLATAADVLGRGRGGWSSDAGMAFDASHAWHAAHHHRHTPALLWQLPFSTTYACSPGRFLKLSDQAPSPHTSLKGRMT